MIKDITEHNYIKILEYAYKTKVFTESEICKALNLSKSGFESYVRGSIAQYDLEQATGSEQKWVMGYEAFLNYLEYIELKEARDSSRQAKTISIWAIIISGFLALSSIGISLYQLNKSSQVIIENKEFEVISNSIELLKNELNPISNKLTINNPIKSSLPVQLNEKATNKPIKPMQ